MKQFVIGALKNISGKYHTVNGTFNPLNGIGYDDECSPPTSHEHYHHIVGTFIKNKYASQLCCTTN